MEALKENAILAPYTIYKIGGAAKYFVEVRNAKELEEALVFSSEKNLPFFILGAGSNVLISDKGFGGLVIKMKGEEIRVEGDRLLVDAGVMMARAVLASAKAGLTGFEWGIGVPGTIGGSVRGNAGCFGGEMKQVIELVQLLEIKNEKLKMKNLGKNSADRIFELNNRECGFGYRDSIFKKHPEWIVLSATLKLKKGDSEKIKEEIKRITLERSAKQDVGTQSCGCIFKNVERDKLNNVGGLLNRFPGAKKFENQFTIPASFLIDEAGLKGKKIGHVFVSPKHANFFVNEGKAKAKEVLELIGFVKREVKDKFGIVLEEEIQLVGF